MKNTVKSAPSAQVEIVASVGTQAQVASESVGAVKSIDEKIIELTKGIKTKMMEKKGGTISSLSSIQATDILATVAQAKLFTDLSVLAKQMRLVLEFLNLPCDEKSLAEPSNAWLGDCLERVLDSGKAGKLFIRKIGKDTPKNKMFLAHGYFLEMQGAAQKAMKAGGAADMLF